MNYVTAHTYIEHDLLGDICRHCVGTLLARAIFKGQLRHVRVSMIEYGT